MRNIILILTILICFVPPHSFDFPKIKGWDPVSEVTVYNSENLYEYINGAADDFILYGFQALYTRDFSSEDIKVTIDIYKMSNPLNSFGKYRKESSSNQNKLSIGTEAVISTPYQCLLLKDAFYVKINVFEGEITESIGQELLVNVAKRLPGQTELPEELKLLPQKGKISNSEMYFKTGFPGEDNLENLILADYKLGDNAFSGFIILPEKGNESNKTIWTKIAKQWENIQYKGNLILYKEIPHYGATCIIFTNKKLSGITKCENKEEMIRILEELNFKQGGRE